WPIPRSARAASTLPNRRKRQRQWRRERHVAARQLRAIFPLLSRGVPRERAARYARRPATARSTRRGAATQDNRTSRARGSRRAWEPRLLLSTAGGGRHARS